jgi:hypothetical protein
MKALGTVLSLLLLTAAGAQAAVWEVRNEWSDEWERRYSEWVRTHWDHHFFAREGTPYTGLKLDCADVVYSMRIIFSAENGLPFAMKDSTGGRNPISNAMSRWDSVADQGQRVRRFLQFIYGVASTHSLPYDTIPVAITREHVRPGGLLRADKLSHHSWTIKDVLPTGILHLVYSSRPAKTTILHKIGLPSTGFLFKGGLKPEREAGFRYFRQPKYLGKPAWEVPGYSLEQYQIPAATWRAEIQKRIQTIAETADQKLRRLLNDVCQGARERVVAVGEALDQLRRMAPNACMNATQYDDFSTPNRDERLQAAFDDLAAAYREITATRVPVSTALLHEARDVVERDDSTLGGAPVETTSCAVEIGPGHFLSLGEVRKRSLGGLLSHNPHDPIELRWGDRTGHSARAKRCPTFE